MALHRLEDGDDPRIADYHGVKDPEWVQQRGLFIAEGHVVVSLLLERSTLSARSLLLTETALARLAPILAVRAASLDVYVASPRVMDTIAGFDIHQGCLALGERPDDLPLPAFLAGLTAERPRLLALEQVSNPDNVGAIFRNARAFRADGILLGPGCSHPLYRKSIRTSMGSALLLPFTRLPDWHAGLRALRARGLALLALTPDGAAETLAAVASPVARQGFALLLGHEGEGLSAATLELSDRRLRIPIDPDVDSLNVATAAAIALHALSGSGTLPGVAADGGRREEGA